MLTGLSSKGTPAVSASLAICRARQATTFDQLIAAGHLSQQISHSRIKHHNENSPFKMFLRLSTRHSLATRMASISSTALETLSLITR